MALTRIRLGTNEDGTPLWHYHQDDPNVPVVVTGPITGSVTLPDGRVVEVSDAVIEVKDEATALAVAEAIAERHVDEGHPLFVNDPTAPSDGFEHVKQEG